MYYYQYHKVGDLKKWSNFKTKISLGIKDILECERVNLYQEDIKLMNICASNKRAPKCMKQNLAEQIEITGNSTILPKDTNNSILKISRSR